MASFYHEFTLKIEALAECERAYDITRSPAQKPACKDLGRNGQARAHHAQGRLYSGF